MEIIQTKQVNLLELIRWAWEKDIYGRFKAINNENVIVNINGAGIDTDNCSDEFPTKDTLFEIEEEIEIDEYTKLNKIIHINGFDSAYVLRNSSINDRIESSQHKNAGTKFIYLQNEDGSIGDLIWANGKMVD